MLKVIVAVVGIALVGTASAAGWRSLRLDGSSEAAFEQSLAEFRDKLTPGRRYAFILALPDREQRTIGSGADQREYTAADYLQHLDGLDYEQVVTFTDPTGDTARRNGSAYNPLATGDAQQRVAGMQSFARRDTWQQRAPIGPHGQQVRGIVDTGPLYQHQLRTMGQ